ncbi:hypothetical protein SMC26_24105 [Actinomadura fulvescens]|uniref:Uncharacterized protein n=1 Tax=Actinomadura fulvescens TaxID=46160 RepID=A0ABP6CHH8_9ACTN
MSQSDMCFWLLLLAALIVLFTGPTVIALFRGVDDIGFIILLNAIAFVTLIALPVAYLAAIRAVPQSRGPYPPTTHHQ